MAVDVMANARKAVDAEARKVRRPKAEPQLKAYLARSYDGESDVIVFAHRNNMAARREAAGMMASGDITDVDSLKRAPEFDDLAEASVITSKDYIERGWWFECAGCCRRVSSDMNDWSDGADDEEDADGNLRDGNGELLEPSYHVLHPSSVWCSAGCRDQDREHRFREKVQACEEREKWTAAATARWPGITNLRVYRQDFSKPETIRVAFQAPGFARGHFATWHPLESPDVLWIAQGSLSAWDAYTADLMNAQNRDPGDEHLGGRRA